MTLLISAADMIYPAGCREQVTANLKCKQLLMDMKAFDSKIIQCTTQELTVQIVCKKDVAIKVVSNARTNSAGKIIMHSGATQG